MRSKISYMVQDLIHGKNFIHGDNIQFCFMVVDYRNLRTSGGEWGWFCGAHRKKEAVAGVGEMRL